MWDDTALIQAYDKAVNLAKEEVAKRIAMDAQDRRTKKFQNSKRSIQKPFRVWYILLLLLIRRKNIVFNENINLLFCTMLQKWSVGAPCRAVYSEDGEVYEAIVSEIYENSGTCLVEFVGNYLILMYDCSVILIL